MFMKQCLAREPLRNAQQRGAALGWERKHEGETAERALRGKTAMQMSARGRGFPGALWRSSGEDPRTPHFSRNTRAVSSVPLLPVPSPPRCGAERALGAGRHRCRSQSAPLAGQRRARGKQLNPSFDWAHR